MIQADSGTVTPAASSFTPTLPNPTTDGSTLLLFIGTSGAGTPVKPSADPPWYADQVHAGHWYVWRRDEQPAGETSWPVTSSASARWAWRVEEWASLSTIAQPDTQSANAGVPAFGTCAGIQDNSIANAQGSLTQASPDVTDYRAVALFHAVAGSAIWPAAHTYSSGWAEVQASALGDGTVSTDFMLMVAESYPGTIGSLDCTMSWDITGGGTYAEKSVDVWVACYQPAVIVPFGVLTA